MKLKILYLASLACFIGVIFWLTSGIPLWSKILLQPLYDDTAKDGEASRNQINFVGDVLLARQIELNMIRFGAALPYRSIASYLQSGYTVVNFEAAVPEKHVLTPSYTFAFSVDKQFLPALRSAGVTHASLANNHAYDYGVAGFAATKAALTAVGITSFGGDTQYGENITFITIGGSTIAVVGLNTVSDVIDYEQLQTIMYSTTLQSDFQIAYIHWGNEYVTTHAPSQRKTAEDLVALGFDAIIGHHPHVVQDIDYIDGVPVFYSLGNFIFDQYFSTAVQEGLMLTLQQEENGYVFRLLPVTSVGTPNQPRMMDEIATSQFLVTLAANSAPSLRSAIASGRITVTP